ncbi:Serine/threonine-protein kinase smg1 [Coemansia asiatica]|nr:Serine/threonine-protein kinase smg1 [Coemansia asiatica]
MAIASRVVTLDRLSDISDMVCFWMSELKWVVASWVAETNATDRDDAFYLLVMKKIESVHLLCHLIDLALSIDAIDRSLLAKCICECVDIVSRDSERVALAAYLPLVNLTGIVSARNDLDENDARLALDIARIVIKQMTYLEPATLESAIALVYCLATNSHRLDIDCCVAEMLKTAVSVVGFGHKQLKLSVGQFVQALLAKEPRAHKGLVDATYILLGDDSSKVRGVWSQVASMLARLPLSSVDMQKVTDFSPVTAYLRNGQLFSIGSAFGKKEIDECAYAMTMDDALNIIGSIVGSSKGPKADLVADIGLSSLALQCIYSIYRATATISAHTGTGKDTGADIDSDTRVNLGTNTPSGKSSCSLGIYEKILLMAASSSRRVSSAEPPSECLSTASYVIDAVKQCEDRSIGAMFWMLELIFHLCQPGRPAHSLLADCNTKILLFIAASECSNIAFSGFISPLIVQQLQDSPETFSDRRKSSIKKQIVEAISQLASKVPLNVLARTLDFDIGDAFSTVSSWCVADLDLDLDPNRNTISNELYSLRLSDNCLIDDAALQDPASIRLSRFDIGAENKLDYVFTKQILDLENIHDYFDSHKYNLFLADRFLDRAICRATRSLSATTSGSSNSLELFVEKTYFISSLPAASECDKLIAVSQAFARGDISPGQALRLLCKWICVDKLDADNLRILWKTYSCSAISAAFNRPPTNDVETSADTMGDYDWMRLDPISAALDQVPVNDRLDMLFARNPCADAASFALETSVFMHSYCHLRDKDFFDFAAATGSGIDTTKAKEALLYLGSGDNKSSHITNMLFTDLLQQGTGKIRFTARGVFDPASHLISRMSTNPTQSPVLLLSNELLNRNAQIQLAPFIPQLFAMLCFNRNSHGSDVLEEDNNKNASLVNDSAFRILQCLAKSAPELLVFYAVVNSKSLPRASRGGQFVSQLLSLFDPALVADIRLFLLLTGSVAVLPQEQLRRACIKAKTAHHRAVTALMQAPTNIGLQAAVDEALRPVHKVISEFVGREAAQSLIETEFIAQIPRLKLLVDQLSSRSIDMTPQITSCLRGFEVVWSEIFKTANTASSLAIQYISPRLVGFCASIPIPSLTDPTEPLYFAQIGSSVRVIGSKTRPKLLSLHLASKSGEITRHKYILKGSEDLRIDECVMQTFVRLNRVLGSESKKGPDGNACLAVYNVVPIDTYGGLLQVVDNAPSMFHLYSKHASSAAMTLKPSKKADNQKQQQQQMAPPTVPAGFHQIYMSQAQEVLERFGLSVMLPIDKWPQRVFVAIHESLVEDGVGISNSLLYSHLLRAAQSSSHMFLAMQNMVRSIAIASIAGYIVGLGDRHLDNLLVDANVGQLVHVDFNVCFDFGSVSQIPEQVPFRMSPALSYLCGTPQSDIGSSGKSACSRLDAFSFSRVFEGTARSVLKCARMDRHCLVDAIVSRSLFRPFMEWCWMEESRLREQRRQSDKRQSGLLSPIIQSGNTTFAFPQTEGNSTSNEEIQRDKEQNNKNSSLLLLRPPQSLSAEVIDRVWNQRCETMRTDEFVRTTGLCPPNGFWPRRSAVAFEGLLLPDEEAALRHLSHAETSEQEVYPITEVPYGWRIAKEARDRVDARLAYDGGNRLRDDDELVAEQIRVLWEAATCKDRLAKMFMGWASWI